MTKSDSFCTNCGNSLKVTAKFCSTCGTKVGTISQDTGQPTTESKDWQVRKTQPDETDTQYEATMRAEFGHTKKQSRRFKKFAIGCGIFVVALVILAGFGSSNNASTNELGSGLPAEYNADIPLEFDPLMVATAKENIPNLQELAKVVLRECRNVNSYSDYQVFALALAANEEIMLETLHGVDDALTVLELEGYDEHPEIGPLIKETRSLYVTTGNCLDDVMMRYGN